MAWNPSPEVAVARDAAKVLESTPSCRGQTVQHCIVLYTTSGGKIGYASYGPTKPACAEARKLADAAYNAVMERAAEVL